MSLAGSGAVLAACGKAGKTTGLKGGPAPAATQGTPRRGGTASLGLTTDPHDWDISYLAKNGAGRYGIPNAYDGLLGRKTGPDVKYGDIILTPKLAQKWESPDAQTYTFHLRQNVKFASIPPVNGRELSSDDVKWTYEYVSRTGAFADKHLPRSPLDYFLDGLDHTETPDASTAVVRFKQPYAPFSTYAAQDLNPILPHEIFDQFGNFKDHIAGTGPWQLDSAGSQRGSHWHWVRNPTYWQAGLPYLDAITWLVIPDTAALISAFRSKQIDWIGEANVLNYQAAADLRKSDPTAVQYSYILAPIHLYMNTRVKPLNDVRVRQAISLGIDRDQFIKTFAGGQGSWVLAGAFPDTFTEEEIKQILRYDPQKAKQLLAAAGYPNGLSLEFTYPGTQFGDIYTSEMQLLQAQLKTIGVNLNLQSLDSATYSGNKKAGRYVITFTPKDLLGDVDSYCYAVFYTGSGANYGGVSDPKLDALLDAQRREADPSKRRELVRQAVRYINEQAYGLAIFAGEQYEDAQSRLKNYYPQFTVFEVPGVQSWLQT